MTFSRRVAWAIVWALSLVSASVLARSEQQPPPSPPSPLVLPGPVVLSGADLGFRVHGIRGETRIGRLVVRVDGKWVDVQFAVGISPAGQTP
jgi:hypothetical protein